MTYLHHVTLATGHQRRSPRAEVAESAMAVMAAWLDRALLVEAPQPLPVPGYTAEAMTAPGGLVVTVSAVAGVPLVTFGVARRARNAAGLWRRLSGLAQVQESEPPPAPWIGVVVLPALATDPAVRWLGDFERCIAWAWIERVAD